MAWRHHNDEAFESGVLDLKDFYFTGDDYSYEIEIEAKRRFLQLLKERFNSGVEYKGRVLMWNTIIEQKTDKLGRYLIGKSESLDFSGPEPQLERTDNLELRKRVLSLRLVRLELERALFTTCGREQKSAVHSKHIQKSGKNSKA